MTDRHSLVWKQENHRTIQMDGTDGFLLKTVTSLVELRVDRSINRVVIQSIKLKLQKCMSKNLHEGIVWR